MAGTWKALTNQPNFAASTMLLLTDGTVMCQTAGGKDWWRLTPDGTGSYTGGTWSQLASMKNTRLYFASAVLRDGRVFVAGGEYSDGGGDLDAAEIYDPLLDTWTSLPTPAGWTNIGDAPCCVLPDGRLMLGYIDGTSTAIYDPDTNTWSAAASKDDASSEETWTLLPDETILVAECSNHPKSEKYVIPAEKWVTAGNIPDDLVQASSIEIGPAILLPDGTVFASGATGHTAIYTPPPVADQQGTWVAGPDFPDDGTGNLMGPKDAPAALLTNGNVLCVASPHGEGGSFPGPTSFFEYDGTNLVSVPAPANASGPCFTGRMLLLPTGEVLFASGSSEIYAYQYASTPDPTWKPEITHFPAAVFSGFTYQLSGRQLNGLSQAVSYGDDGTMATNYPLVRIRNIASGKVHYCRTFDHTTMGVATGTAVHSTYVYVPFGIQTGDSEVCVIANGIATCTKVKIKPWKWWFNLNEEMVNFLIGSLADGPLWVLGPNGPVPVDPMNHELADAARQAIDSIVSSVKELQQLGQQAVAARGKEMHETNAPAKPSGERRRGA